jgi:hypothetical protein
MIEIEFRRPQRGAAYDVAATIRVDDDGQVTTTGDAIDMIIDVSIADRSRPTGRLTFEDDPAEWVRNARKAFRTPYLVPVVTHDSTAPALV